jgi:5-methylcytosine-specific restriction endonuclease McrA
LKRCTKCKEVKPTSEFYRASKERDGLKSCCKACQSEAQKQYAAAYNHAYYLDHGEELRARARDYFHEHVEENRRRARQWAKENPERYHELQRVHRHKKRSNGGSFTAAEWDALCGHFNYLCACCHERRPLTVDHIVPVLLGGGSDISNIQPLCRACNSAKGMSVRDYR